VTRRQTPRPVQLIPIGIVSETLLRTLGADLYAAAEMQCSVGEAMPLVDEWRDAGSEMYRSGEIMQALIARHGADAGTWKLAIADAGLCAAGVGPVFGEAAMDGCCAVVGVQPLRWGSGADADVLRGRLLTEALHELAHLDGADHCGRASCVMYPSLHIADTDRKAGGFCDDCRRALKWRRLRNS
jgi:archaemetzincin